MGHIPAFEGHPVEATIMKMSGAAPLHEMADVVIGVDDVVQMISQFRCIGIDHKVDEKTGLLVRVQLLRPMEFALMPNDPSDPDDDGIIRAMPGRSPRELESGQS